MENEEKRRERWDQQVVKIGNGSEQFLNLENSSCETKKTRKWEKMNNFTFLYGAFNKTANYLEHSVLLP